MQKLGQLKHNLLSENVLNSFAKNRITTVFDFLQEDAERLCNLSKLNISQVLILRDFIFSKYSAPLINGTALLKRTVTLEKFISTGLPSLDTLLGGGIPLGYITEICGLADCGKTQLCFQLAINYVRNTNGTVLYVDTKGDFSAVRIQKILESLGLTHKEMAVVMHKIKVIYLWNMEEIVNLFQNIKNKTIHFLDLLAIIVDSLPCLMFQFLGDSNKVGLTLLNKYVNYSRFLCNVMNISVICTNIQTRWVDQDVSDLEDDKEQTATTSKEIAYVEKQNRCLGNYWRHVPVLVLLLEKSSANDIGDHHQISVTSIKSYNKEIKKCILKLSALGVT